MTQEQKQDKAKLMAALLNLETDDYVGFSAELIRRLGYDAFRDIQNEIFKEIGTIKSEQERGES